MKRIDVSPKNADEYFSVINTKERMRLENQQKLMLDFDIEVYKKYLSNKKNLIVLDLGCNDSNTTYMRLKNFDIKKLVGLDINRENILSAQKNYENENFKFYLANLEDKNFESKLVTIMKEQQIEKFDVVNALALFAHLSNPIKVMKTVLKYCSDDCLVFVRNIDDGFNVCYPNKYVKKALTFLNKTKFTGFRNGGREVNNILKKAGIKDVSLEKNGISNLGLTQEQKECLFSTIFDFIYLSLKKDTNNVNAKKMLNYLDKNWLNIRKAFFRDDFFINLGFMFYVGKGKNAK